MTTARRILISVATAALLAGHAAGANASETYSFPSASGLSIATAPRLAPTADAKVTLSVVSGTTEGLAPLSPASPAYSGTFTTGTAKSAADAYAYRFFTHALTSQSYSNYAADYYRLFAPGRAVSTWTDRMFGLVDAGYGGAVDGWTAASYYLGRVRGPVRRRETAPDLSIMPTFRAHPELSAPPTFNKTN